MNPAWLPKILPVTGLLSGISGVTQAVDTDVIVTTDQYTDAFITIREGDTVTWRGVGEDALAHQVVALDDHAGLFSSGAPTTDPFEFSWTFHAAGFYVYGCNPHLPEQRGFVAVQPDDSGLPIDARFEGAWYDPAAPGQGIFVDVDDASKRVFLGWFTFGPEGQRWLTAEGPFTDNHATLTVFESTGGRFLEDTPVETRRVGVASLSFPACDRATFRFALNDEGLSDTVAFTPIYFPAGCVGPGM